MQNRQMVRCYRRVLISIVGKMARVSSNGNGANNIGNKRNQTWDYKARGPGLLPPAMYGKNDPNHHNRKK
jgi:hypothetical protein